MLDSYFKLVNRISRSFDHNFGTPRAKERKKWIHAGFMFTTLGLLCLCYCMYSSASPSYLNCINQAHQDCNNIKTQCHIVKYNKTICVDRHNSDIRLNVGDLVKKDMIVTYFDVYSNPRKLSPFRNSEDGDSGGSTSRKRNFVIARRSGTTYNLFGLGVQTGAADAIDIGVAVNDNFLPV